MLLLIHESSECVHHIYTVAGININICITRGKIYKLHIYTQKRFKNIFNNVSFQQLWIIFHLDSFKDNLSLCWIYMQNFHSGMETEYLSIILSIYVSPDLSFTYSVNIPIYLSIYLLLSLTSKSLNLQHIYTSLPINIVISL